jgi:predicted transcriptional regulator
MSDKHEKDSSISEILNKIVKNKVNGNRRYIDEILEKIQDRNRNYFLAKFEEMKAKEEAEKAGNLDKAQHHKVMAETYKSIVERCFADNR